MKNRTRENCTSGSVRDEDGNILIYSAAPLPAHQANNRTMASTAAMLRTMVAIPATLMWADPDPPAR